MVKLKKGELGEKELVYIGIIAVLLVVLVLLSSTVNYLSAETTGQFYRSAGILCKETDGGYDIFTKGTCKGSGEQHTDFCRYGGLIEYGCKDGQCISKKVACPEGHSCIDGACVAQCTDTDGGIDLFEAGTCTDSTGSATDVCLPDGGVGEYHCSELGNCLGSSNPCPEGTECSNGACIMVPPEADPMR